MKNIWVYSKYERNNITLIFTPTVWTISDSPTILQSLHDWHCHSPFSFHRPQCSHVQLPVLLSRFNSFCHAHLHLFSPSHLLHSFLFLFIQTHRCSLDPSFWVLSLPLHPSSPPLLFFINFACSKSNSSTGMPNSTSYCSYNTVQTQHQTAPSPTIPASLSLCSTAGDQVLVKGIWFNCLVG